MVELNTVSTIGFKKSTTTAAARTSSVDASYSDPDLLIREYFLSSSSRRAISRKIVIKHINTLTSIFTVLGWGASGKVRNGYDGAVSLLAEIDSFELLRKASQTIEQNYLSITEKHPGQNFIESSFEILIKSIACAYKIDAGRRLKLLIDILPQLHQRIIKASIIDALVLISDEVDLNDVRRVIQNLEFDSDQYIRSYAAEALQDIS
jgi:hypothetical protein